MSIVQKILRMGYFTILKNAWGMTDSNSMALRVMG